MKPQSTAVPGAHTHVFLGAGHERNERRTWAVIGLCSFMMVAGVAGGTLFGSLALVADGLHMSTHAAALLIAALAYTYARRHADDTRFVFGTGKLGDLAGYTSAIVLAMIALLIGYEAIMRFLAPVQIKFAEAVPIAFAGLVVNIASAWLLRDDEHHGHEHRHAGGAVDSHGEPHEQELRARVYLPGMEQQASFSEHAHDGKGHPSHSSAHTAARDNNLRAAYVHVIADAAVSVLAITGLLLARYFGWNWMDPLAGFVGALVIGNWAYRLCRDTGGILLDVNPDPEMTQRVRSAIEAQGDRLVDLHLWRLGPGHLGAVLSILSLQSHDVAFYRSVLSSFPSLSHVTVEVQSPPG